MCENCRVEIFYAIFRMGTPLTCQGIRDLMSDPELDWLKIYDDAVREGLKTRAELLFGISDFFG